jgi:hypothetical protein
MSLLEVPLLGKFVWKTGDILLRAELDLLIKDNTGGWQLETFRVDPGTEMTSMPAALARSLDLPMPINPVPGGLDISGVKREVRSGLLRVQIPGMDATEYVFPCFFVGDPSAPVDPKQPPRLARSLLGLTGVVDKIRIVFDGTGAAGFPHGRVTIERI